MDINDSHERSVLIGILDPETRKHTAMHQGQLTPLHEFKKIIMEFTNAVSTSDPMQLGRTEGTQQPENQEDW
eukprot:5238971-Karenia_brevis.AAC.1